MKERCEYEIRLKAIRIYDETGRFGHAVESVHRSRGWLSKWFRRYRKFGLEGLRDQSRVPRHIPNQTPESLVRKILALRDELAASRTRRAAFAGVGANTIHFEIHRQGIRRLPAISTIEKILARAGKTKKVKFKRAPGGPPYPYVPARKMGDLQQTDLVEPRHLRGPGGVTRFYSIHTLPGPGLGSSASAILDRLSMNGRFIICEGRSYRSKK